MTDGVDVLTRSDSKSIRERISEIYRLGYVVGEDDVRYPIAPISVASWRGEFVRELCADERATSSVEVGMAWGLSTLHILEALLANGAGDGAHVVIDPMQTSVFHNAARRTLREAGVDAMVEFHEAPSDLVLPKLISEGRQFDFAFIDGDHRFEGAFLDAVFVDRLLKPGGVVALDDTWAHPVYLACKFLEVYFHYAPVAEQLKPPGDNFAGAVKNPAPGAELPKMRAYRKPISPPARDEELDFARFALEEANLPAPIAYWHAKRLTTLGLRALSEGRKDEARRALATAMRLNPARIKSYSRWLRTMLPSWMARRLSGQTGRGEKVPSDG
jgi:predicted O-methyltransferase YrrM